MNKSPDAFRTISEVAEWLDVPTHVLRFWESRFTQVKPVKRAGGRRYYRPSDMALLGGIKKLLHEDGLTIRGVQKVLREQGVKHVAALVPAPGGQSVEAVAEPVALPEIPVSVGQLGPDTTPPAARPGDAPELDLDPAATSAEAAGPADAASTEDPDAALRRFPFVDDVPEEVAPEALPEDEPAEDEPVEPAPVAFAADVPDTDPEDEDDSIGVPGALSGLVLPGAAARLRAHGDALGALYARACALRDRMASRPGAE